MPAPTTPTRGAWLTARSSAAHELLHALLHLVGRHVLDMGGHAPAVAEGVRELAAAVTVELVLHLAQCGGPRLDRGVEDRVGVLHIEVDQHRRPADGLGTEDPDLRVLIGEHYHRVAHLHLGVADLPVRGGHMHALATPEDLDVELDRLPGAVHA